MLGLFASPTAFADLSLTIEQNRIDIGDTFGATFTYDGDTEGQSPDFSALAKDFDIRATSTMSRHQIINGSASASVTWTLTLAPKHAGTLLVPSLSFRNERSPAAQVEVVPLDPRAKAQLQHMVFFTNEVTPIEPYVQAQLSYTRRLYYTSDAQLYGPIPAAPDVPNVIVQQLAAPTPNNEVRNGVTYGVVEQRFALFPQSSGDFVIPNVAVQSSMRDAFGQRRQTGIESGVVKVHVLPKPDAYPANAAWLPAHSLRIYDAGNSAANANVGANVARVGDAISRTIVVAAEGLSATALPNIPLAELSGVKMYASQPQFNESTDGKYITGTRTQTITWVPTAPGQLTLPAIAVTWWDADQHMTRVATLPARLVTVTGTASMAAPKAAPPQPTNASPAKQSDEQHAESPLATRIFAALRSVNALLVIIALICAGSWLISAGRTRTRKAGLDSAKQESTPALSASRASTPRPSALRLAIDHACKANNPFEARRALAAWLAARWEMPEQVSLTLVAKEPVIADLNAAAFGSSKKAWKGAALREWLAQVPVKAPSESARPQHNALPALYP